MRAARAARHLGPAAPRGARRLERHLALLRAFWSANLAEELQYRGNLIANLLGVVFWMGTAVLTAALFFRQAPALGGWSFWEVVALLGVFNTVGGVVEAVVRPNVGRIEQYVRRGTLDLILAKPVDPQFHMSFRRVEAWRSADVLLGLGLTSFALVQLERAPSALELAAFALTLASAVTIVYAIWLTLLTFTFWWVSVDNLEVLFDAVYEAARFPVSVYPGPLRFVFVYLLPIAWITTVPAASLIGRTSPATALLAAGVATAALVLTRRLWWAGLRRYTSAGG
ncbi:MAG: ABC-2 family transporter protein [Gemmatimonadetes bacterium]|nr:ABC-2 family transporter protein [Gemmatimonadota bacterium]